MNDAVENFEDFHLLHHSSVRIPKDKFRVREIGYEDRDENFVINIDYENILEVISTDQSLSFSQLFGRALARTRINKPLKSLWTFISQEDLQKTGTQNPVPALFHQIIKNIKNLVSDQPIAVILWQDKSSVSGAVISDYDDDVLVKLSGSLGTEEKENFVIIGPYKNFSDAEIKIQRALKEVVL